MGARVLRDPWLQPLPSAEPAAQVATPPKQRLCAVEKQGRLVAKAVGQHRRSILWPAGRLDSVLSSQHSMPLLSRCSQACQEEGRQSGQRELGGAAHQRPHTLEHLPGLSVSTEQAAEAKGQREGRCSPSRAGMQRMPGAFPLPVSPASPAARVAAASLTFPQPLPPTFGSLFPSRTRASRGR